MATAKEKREAREREAAAAAKSEQTNQEFMRNPGAVESAHGEIAQVQSSGAKVTVACKLGIPWLELQLSRIEEIDEQGLGTRRLVKEGRKFGPVVRIRGTAYPRGTPPEGFPPAPLIIAGAAMNPGVDKDFWDAWVKMNRLNPLVMNGMIFAHESESAVHGIAREEAANQSGLEPINPKNDLRNLKSTRADVDDIQPDDRRKPATRVA
jgi:hypothetical protein